MTPAADSAALKRAAAEYAATLVESGMMVGLGTGSTAIFATRRIAERIASGELRDITGVPTSRATAEEAQRLGIVLVDDEWRGPVDVTIDGADEVDPAMNLIKGGGAALLREKIVAQASTREVIVVDESKLSAALGSRFALPVEVVPFGGREQQRFLESLGARVTLRGDGRGGTLRTDQGNQILDCAFGPIGDVEALARSLSDRAGIVEHGLFVGLATDLIVASSDGVQHRRR